MNLRQFLECVAYYDFSAVLDDDVHAVFYILEEFITERVDYRHPCGIVFKPYVSKNGSGSCQ